MAPMAMSSPTLLPRTAVSDLKGPAEETEDLLLLEHAFADDPAFAKFRGPGGAEAFKQVFFNKLLHPELYQLPFRSNLAGEGRSDPIWFLDMMHWRSAAAPQTPEVLEALLRGEVTVTHDGTMGSDRTNGAKRVPAPFTRLSLGPLGRWNWALVPPEPVGLLFTRGVTGVNMAQAPLLRAYEETGDERMLAAWMTITDDWARNFTTAADQCTSHNIRFYFVTCLYDFLLSFIGELARVARRRPAFVTQLKGTLLIRVIMRCLVEYVPATIRQLRALIINHRPAGVVFLVLTGMLFYEFRIGRWCLAQAKRLWETNWTLRTFPDGGPAEWNDIGHEQMDMIYMGNLLKRVQALSRGHPGIAGWLDGTNKIWAIPESDARRANARYILRHLKPDGFRFRWDAVTNQREAVLGAAPNAMTVDNMMRRFMGEPASLGEINVSESLFYANPARNNPAVLGSVLNVNPELLVNEAPCASLADAVFGPVASLKHAAGADRDDHLQALLLDMFPFKGQYYIRDGWSKDDYMFASFICRPSPSANGRHDDGRLQLYGHGQHLLNMPPVRVNGMPPNRYNVAEWPLHDKVGGKAMHILHAARGDVSKTRAHHGSFVDLVEGSYTGGYEAARPPHSTVDHAQHIRQVLLLRPIGAWLVVDRVVSREPVTVDVDIEMSLPHYEWDAPATFNVNDEEHSIQTSSVGLAGCLVKQVCPFTSTISYADTASDPILATAAAATNANGSSAVPQPNAWARSGHPRFRRTLVSTRTTTARMDRAATEHALMTLVLPQRGCSPVMSLRDVKRNRTYEARIVEVHASESAVTLELLNGARHEKLPLKDLDPDDAERVRAWTPNHMARAHDTALRGFDARFTIKTMNEPAWAGIHIVDRAQNATIWALTRRTRTQQAASRGTAATPPLTCPKRLQAHAELLLVCEKTEDSITGLILGCTDRTMTHLPTGRKISLPSADVEFSIDMTTGQMWASSRVETPVAPLTFEVTMPTTFSSPLRVRLNRPSSDVSVHYSVDGHDPTPNDPVYDNSEPPFLQSTAIFKARAFRRDASRDPLRADVDVHALTSCLIASPVLCGVFVHRPLVTTGSVAPSSATISLSSSSSIVVHNSQPQITAVPIPVAASGEMTRGLRVRALSGSWMDLFANATSKLFETAALPVQSVAAHPLDGSTVSSSRAAAHQEPHHGLWVEYSGVLWVHNAGVHTLFAPPEWMSPWNTECGYDLHVFVDDELWEPSTQRALLGKWSLPLTNGAHSLRVIWVDARTPTRRHDTWRDFPARHVLWKEPVPVLEWDAGRPGHRETFGLGCCFHYADQA